MATNYERGRYTEYKSIKDLKKMGYFWTTRSPASKGLFDVTGIGIDGGIALQLKRTKRKRLVPSMYQKDFDEIQEWLDEIGELPDFIKIQFWIHRDGIRGWVKIDFRPHEKPIVFEGMDDNVRID